MGEQGKRILVQNQIFDEFRDRLVQKAASLRCGKELGGLCVKVLTQEIPKAHFVGMGLLCMSSSVPGMSVTNIMHLCGICIHIYVYTHVYIYIYYLYMLYLYAIQKDIHDRKM